MSEHGPSEWLALHRVHEGGVAKVAGIYLDHGYPVPSHLIGLFDRLTWAGLLMVAEGDPVWDLRQLSLTDAGQVRYAALCAHRQQSDMPVPPTEFGTERGIPADCRSTATPQGRHRG